MGYSASRVLFLETAIQRDVNIAKLGVAAVALSYGFSVVESGR